MTTPIERIKARANGHTPTAVPAAFRELFASSRLQPVVPTFAGSWSAACPACTELDHLRLEYAGGRMAARCTGGCTIADINAALGVTLDELPAAVPAAPPRLLQHPAAAAAEKPRFEFVDSAEFAGGDYKPSWLIKGVLVRGEPGLVAAPVKSLKTSLAVDACISLASATPLLSTFEVPAAVVTAIASAESGRNTLQNTAKRICSAKGIRLEDLGPRLVWCFTVPVLSDLAALAAFVAELKARAVGLVLLDPLYLALGQFDPKNMFETGMALKGISDMLVTEGITPLIVHHANKQLKTGEPMELSDIAYSGCDAFARQFILLNRREKYMQDGEHKLWMRIGGSAGHGGLYGVAVSEGLTDENFGGRHWHVTVTNAADLATNAATEREEAAANRERKKIRDAEELILKGIESEQSKGRPAATVKALRAYTGWQLARVKEVVGWLLEDDLIEPHEWTGTKGNGASQKMTGYRRPVPREPSSEQGVTSGLPPVHSEVTPCSPGSREGQGVTGGNSLPLKGESYPLPPVPEPQTETEEHTARKPATNTKRKRRKGKA